MNEFLGSRSIKNISYSRVFLKHVHKLPGQIVKKAEEKEHIFKQNPFHPSLGIHKLSGKERDHWAFWITRSYRIKFIFLTDEEVLFLDIGTHNIYE